MQNEQEKNHFIKSRNDLDIKNATLFNFLL